HRLRIGPRLKEGGLKVIGKLVGVVDAPVAGHGHDAVNGGVAAGCDGLGLIDGDIVLGFEVGEDLGEDIDVFGGSGFADQVAQGGFEQGVAGPQYIDANEKGNDGVEPYPTGKRDGGNAEDDSDGGVDIGKQMVPIGVECCGTVLVASLNKGEAHAKIEQRGQDG